MESTIVKRLVPVKRIPELYPGAFTVSSIRWLIFQGEHTGFASCVRRLGRKVLIDLDDFEAFIACQRNGGRK